MSADEQLSANELAAEAGTDVERLAQLVAAGVLMPAADGFKPGDVQRVLVVEALEAAGLSVDDLRRGIEAGIVSFEATDLIYGAPGALSARTVAEVADDLGLQADVLIRIVTALGLPQPEPDEPLRARAETQIRAFVTAWRPVVDEGVMVRAARVYSEALRRLTEGWLAIYEEAVLNPLADRAVPWEEMSRLALEPGMAVLAAGRSMLPWLFDLHLTQGLNRLNFDSIERQLGLLGIVAPPSGRPEAIVFADLAGYTSLTEERGDAAAADVATRLAELADEIARSHRGRLVKLLGDGVMLHFQGADDAVEAAARLRDAMAPAGLPPAHTGIHAGSLIRRESDFYGRTVNIAARLAASAAADEILVTRAVTESGRRWAVEPVAPLSLKGITEPVVAFRVLGPADPEPGRDRR